MEWISVKDKLPNEFTRCLVIKHYIDQELNLETGNYEGEWFKSKSHVAIDNHIRENKWVNDGIITHWVPIPKPPEWDPSTPYLSSQEYNDMED